MANQKLTEAKPTSLYIFENAYQPDGISIVIPNYNGKNLFTHTLEPLFLVLDELQFPYEVILVDDCSTDDSVTFIRKRFPQIIILQNDLNSGFSKTTNKGIFAAHYELVFLLNSDIILTTGYFKHQLKYFHDPKTFGVMGRIVGWDDDIIQDAARFPEYHGMKIKTSLHYLLDNMQGESLYTLYLSGANALINRNKLIQLSGFDEIFSPFYVEDCDLSFRAWRLGWNCYYEHKSICRHRTSSSIKAKSKKEYIETIYYRNKLFMHAIHLNGLRLSIYLLQTLLETLIKTIVFRFTLIKSFWLFILQRKDWLRSRNKFRVLVNKEKYSSSLIEVTDKIRSSVEDRPIKIFRSS